MALRAKGTGIICFTKKSALFSPQNAGDLMDLRIVYRIFLTEKSEGCAVFVI